MELDPTKIGAWVASIAGVVALITQAYTIIKRSKKERSEVEKALDNAPYVREQLALGNFKEAAEYLNRIILSQATHIEAQDRQLEQCFERIDHLTDENMQLRMEVQEIREGKTRHGNNSNDSGTVA